MAKAAGIPADKVGAKCFRMGGASDMYDLYGASAERYVRERGRWCSDIAQIYQRVSAAIHGQISRGITDSSGVDLQSLFSGTSPAGRKPR